MYIRIQRVYLDGTWRSLKGPSRSTRTICPGIAPANKLPGSRKEQRLLVPRTLDCFLFSFFPFSPLPPLWLGRRNTLFHDSINETSRAAGLYPAASRWKKLLGRKAWMGRRNALGNFFPPRQIVPRFPISLRTFQRDNGRAFPRGVSFAARGARCRKLPRSVLALFPDHCENGLCR